MLRPAFLPGAVGVLLGGLIVLRLPAAGASAVVEGIDHVPVAVRDLAAAASTYRELGFTLKPGRPHGNGIVNQHAKFPDGTEIELITAPNGVDGLTRTYRRHLDAGDGPAFLALFTPARDRVRTTLAAAGFAYDDGALLSLADDGPVPYVFFGPRQASPTDRPEHFAHRNTAASLVAVWLAGDDLSAERRLPQALGAAFREEEVDVPRRTRASVARFRDGQVVLLPGDFQIVAGRPIVGMTVRVRDPKQARLVAPAEAHGYWLHLRP